ncbi:MAG: type II secretion system protein [Sedimentisphaerales bacterium]|nr:type II secretion system protein [Sedimentisphaerales bacterium]
MSIHAYAHKARQGFTLLELLVVISIIALLLAILFPGLRKAKEHARRVACQNNLHQGLVAGNMYAGDFDGFLPEGNIIDKSAPGYSTSWDSADLLTMMNYQTMRAFGAYGLTEEHATCETARKYFESTDDWLSPLPATRPLVETAYVGWIYWGNRGDWTDRHTGKKYVTAKKVTDQPTSNTLVTCFCYNRYDAVGPGGNWPAWYSSHVGGTFQHAVGRPMKPDPDGLAVGYLDGAARFVKWNDLTPSNHEGNYIVYYDRDT